MKHLRSFVWFALGLGVFGPAAAQSCPGGTTRVVAPASVLRGNTICAVRGGERWQEFHRSGGSLVEYKKGPSDPVDPSQTMGTWAVTGSSAVTYDYGSGGSYTYAVCQVGTSSTYTFVSATAGTVAGVTLLAGQVACP